MPRVVVNWTCNRQNVLGLYIPDKIRRFAAFAMYNAMLPINQPDFQAQPSCRYTSAVIV